MALRLDPEQRFTCRSCGRCCRRWDVFVTAGERESFTRRNVAQWFRETGATTEGMDLDPFEPVPGWRGVFRIRTRDDGSCGFLSDDNRCRIHEQLGEAAKPLTCRMFPFTFHPAAGGAVVTASFGCPTIVANDGDPISNAAARLEAVIGDLKVAATSTSKQFIAGKDIDNQSIHILRESLLRMLARADEGTIDLRANMQRIAALFEDLTRSRVLRLPDADFAEYIKLTVPYAATSTKAPVAQRPGPIGRLMQFGFLFVVCATRYGVEHRTQPAFARRAAGVRLLLHFHGLAPGVDRANVRALRNQRIDLNSAEIQPVAYHYLRSSIEAIGARERPVVDDFVIAVSCLNAACRLAIMNAHAADRRVNREIFSDALMESVDVLQAEGSAAMRWALPRLACGVEALRACGA